MSAIARPLTAGFFESAVADANLKIQLNLDVMAGLNAAVMEGFQKVPRRGLEVGGLLVGHAEKGCVSIEEFEAVDSEHERGPSLLLSAKDKQALVEAVARVNEGDSGMRVVGLYRSQTRAGFAPTEDDAALMREHCPGGVFLLVKPEAGGRCTALFAAGEALHEASETFPFRCGHPAAAVSAPARGPRPVPAPTPAAAPAPEAEPARAEHVPRLNTARVLAGMALDHDLAPQPTLPQPALKEPLPRLPNSRTRVELQDDQDAERGLSLGARIAWTVAILLCAGAGGYGLAHWWTSLPRAEAAAPPSMALHVMWSGASLDLQWNRDSALVRQASRGVLWIDDGPQRRHLDLKPEELTQGSIQYWPSTSDVEFKLEVFTPAGGVSESIRALSVPLPPVAVKPVTAAPLAPAPALQPFVTVEFEAPARKQGSAAKPLHRAVPSVSADLRSKVKEPVQLDIKVDIDATGKVRRTELVSKRSGVRGQFEGLARGASYAWTFTPARNGERRVPSTAILHFRFGNS